MPTKRFVFRNELTVATLALLTLAGGCASRETEIQKAAKDWCMTIRGCQIIPVYPLTEDIQPGDIFLVQVPIDRQQSLYRAQGFLALDNHLARLHPTGYAAFYEHNFFADGSTNGLLGDWIRPRGTNQSWALSPHAAFPSYTFAVRNGAGLTLAVPIQGVPVGLSLPCRAVSPWRLESVAPLHDLNVKRHRKDGGRLHRPHHQHGKNRASGSR